METVKVYFFSDFSIKAESCHKIDVSKILQFYTLTMNTQLIKRKTKRNCEICSLQTDPTNFKYFQILIENFMCNYEYKFGHVYRSLRGDLFMLMSSWRASTQLSTHERYGFTTFDIFKLKGLHLESVEVGFNVL